jgi:tryptophanyl-tRNA synthetase
VTKRILTGIKPTGTPHVGNWVGAIRPALQLVDRHDGSATAMYFIADYHALTQVHDRAKLADYTYEVAATWLALGLDPERVLFYRQSDVPEIFELAWILTCFTPKGWANKAHAYKAALDASRARGEADLDAGISMGVYSYPTLMAADILAFDTDLVPVGKDQVQHIEIARDLADRINHQYQQPVLKPPLAVVGEDTAVVPGVDGQKMSKSYDNTILLFAEEKALRKRVNQFKTDSLPPEAPKDPSTSALFQLYSAVATKAEAAALAERYRAGIGWGDAKKLLADRLDAELAPARARYAALMGDRPQIDALLGIGARRAREIAGGVLDRVRAATGIGARR